MAEPDFIVSELLSELKAENVRKDKQIAELHKVIRTIVSMAIAAVLLVVSGFLLYLYQYDFVDYVEQSAEGTYAMIESNGNTIGQQELESDNNG